MNKFRSYMLTAVGFVVLVSAFSMAAPTTTTAGVTTTTDKTVVVTNTIAEPVPVQGTVAVTNTPTVNAKQSGPWAVTVENAAANPLNVREVAAPLQTVMFHSIVEHSAPRSVHFYTVPAGKRLVVQYINVDAAVETDSAERGVSTSVQAVLTSNRSGVGNQYNIHLQQGPVFDNQRGGFNHLLTANQPVTLYFDAGTELGFGKFSSRPAQLTVAFSGYLIDAN